MDQIKIILTTCATEDDAEKISKALLDGDLAACCNIIRDVRSIFKWKGKIEDEKEVLVLIKTRKGKVKDVLFAVERLHTYDLPPVEVLSIVEASKAFQKWINDETA